MRTSTGIAPRDGQRAASVYTVRWARSQIRSMLTRMPEKDDTTAPKAKTGDSPVASLRDQLAAMLNVSPAHVAGVENRISIIRIVDNMVENAYEMRASDIHVDPAEKDITVRYRIDGVLRDIFTL